MNVGNRIKSLRKQQNMTAAELGKAIGKDRATVYRYENGDIGELPVSVILPLAQKLNVSPIYLLGWEQYTDLTPAQDAVLRDPRLLSIVNDLLKLSPPQQKEFMDLFVKHLDLLADPPKQ